MENKKAYISIYQDRKLLYIIGYSLSLSKADAIIQANDSFYVQQSNKNTTIKAYRIKILDSNKNLFNNDFIEINNIPLEMRKKLELLYLLPSSKKIDRLSKEYKEIFLDTYQEFIKEEKIIYSAINAYDFLLKKIGNINNGNPIFDAISIYNSLIDQSENNNTRTTK